METSYIKLCVDLLPVGMIGVVVVAIMAATMSALSADYNVYGAVLTNDFYNRLIDRKASQRQAGDCRTGSAPCWWVHWRCWTGAAGGEFRRGVRCDDDDPGH